MLKILNHFINLKQISNIAIGNEVIVFYESNGNSSTFYIKDEVVSVSYSDRSWLNRGEANLLIAYLNTQADFIIGV
jgi:hypothetical protein